MSQNPVIGHDKRAPHTPPAAAGVDRRASANASPKNKERAAKEIFSRSTARMGNPVLLRSSTKFIGGFNRGLWLVLSPEALVWNCSSPVCISIRMGLLLLVCAGNCHATITTGTEHTRTLLFIGMRQESQRSPTLNVTQTQTRLCSHNLCFAIVDQRLSSVVRSTNIPTKCISTGSVLAA